MHERGTCPTDLTDARWKLLERLLPTKATEGAGRPRSLSLRQVINGMLYLERTGCQRRLLPKEFPYRGRARYYFDKWTQDGTWGTLTRPRANVSGSRPDGIPGPAQSSWKVNQ